MLGSLCGLTLETGLLTNIFSWGTPPHIYSSSTEIFVDLATFQDYMSLTKLYESDKNYMSLTKMFLGCDNYI